MKQNLFSGGKSKPRPDLSREEFAKELAAIGKREHGPPIDPKPFSLDLTILMKDKEGLRRNILL
jgi:hypothetical protein